MHSGIIAAIAMVFSRYVAYFVPLGDTGLKAVAIGAVLLLSAVNYVGVAFGSAVQAAFTIGKVLAVAVIVVAGFWLGGRLPQHFVGASVAGAGPGGSAVAAAALVVASTFGALAGIVLTGPRVYFSMARDGLLFRWLGTVHPRFGTPHRAVVLQALWSSALVALWSYRALFTQVVYTEWI